MKKNITINLFGALYAIDVDAYDLLKRYIDSMKSYFSKQEGGEEIADDIEHRVAELLWQKKEAGVEAIDIDIIKEIIEKIGNPADIDSEKQDEAGEAAGSASAFSDDGATAEGESETVENSNVFTKILGWFKGRYIYRDPNDKILGGVCSGLAKFFNFGNSVAWRLLFIIFTFLPIPFFGELFIPTVLIYLALWIIVPYAVTPEDRLRMNGKSVTPENIKETIINDSSEQVSKENAYKPANRGIGCLGAILKVCFFLLLLPIIFGVGMALFGLFVVIISMLGFSASVFPYFVIDNPFWAPTVLSEFSWLMVLGLMAALYVLILPIVLLLKALGSSDWRLKRSSGIIYFLTWLFCLVFAIVVAVSTAMNVEMLKEVDFLQRRTKEDPTEQRYQKRLRSISKVRPDAIEPFSTDSAEIDTIGFAD